MKLLRLGRERIWADSGVISQAADDGMEWDGTGT